MSASSQILDAIELLTNNSIKKAAYDKTIQAQIISCEDETIGKYKCRYQDAIIYAYANGADVSFGKGAQVYILVPGNDMNKEKTILGTTKKLGINYISQAEGEEAYDLVGNNCIVSDRAFYLDTNYKNYSYLIYEKDREDNLLTVDKLSLNEYIKKSSSLIIGARFQTKISLEKQFRGHYGIKINLSFYDNATDQIVIRSCTIDQDNMVDNPYRLTYPTRQYQIFDIDGANFKDLQSVEIFCTDFPEANIEDNSLLQDGDIIITSFELTGANRMSNEEVAGVAISFLTPQGTFFSDILPSTEKSIVAQVRIKGKVASESQNIQYYWGLQDNRATPQSQYYNKHLGRGWRCVNENNIISGDEGDLDDPIIEWIPGKDTYIITKEKAVAKDNKIKVAAVYQDVSGSSTVLTREINIQNLSLEIPEVTIESDSGTQFYYDIGHPTLTCKVDNEQKTDYKYYWSYISNTGVFQSFDGEDQIYKKYKEDYNALVASLKTLEGEIQAGSAFANASADELKTLQDNIKSFDLIQRIDNNKIYNVQINRITSRGIFKCSVYTKSPDAIIQENENDSEGKDEKQRRKQEEQLYSKYIGTASITLTNQLEGQGVYSLVINNGSETFQYDQNGVSPACKSRDVPQQIQPLSFTIYDNLGQPIEQKSNKYKIRWEFPIKDSLLQEAVSERQIFNFDSEDEEVDSEENNTENSEEELESELEVDLTGNYKYYTTATLPYKIANTYNISKQRNQIKLTVEYNNMILVASTNFAFVKQGQPGTNGTEYTVKIIPNTPSSNPPLWPMITREASTGYHYLNYELPKSNEEQSEEADPSKPFFKVQLWRSGELIGEGITKEDLQDILASNDEILDSVEWEVLKNNYGKSISNFNNDRYSDNSDFVIKNKNSGKITYTGDTLTLDSSNNSSANIIKCTITINGKKYYGTIPITTAVVLNSDYRIKLKDYTGFRYVMYSSNGLSPSYDKTSPFEIICEQKINDIWEDVSLVNGNYAKSFEFSSVGDYKVIIGTTFEIQNANLLSLYQIASTEQQTPNQQNYQPAKRYDGTCVNTAIVCTCKNKDGTPIAKINIPIHFLLNRNSLANINEWDGNSIQINEDNGFILSPQVGAGFKEDDNSFTGVLIGSSRRPKKSKEEENSSDLSKLDKNQDIGLLGYSKGERTIFLNSQNGSAIFGKAGGGQIILDPTNATEGNDTKALLYSGKFWKNYKDNGLPSDYTKNNQNGEGMLIDLTTPGIRFGNGNFVVNDSGHLTAKGGGQIAGWKINDYFLQSASGSITLKAGLKDGTESAAIYSGNHSTFDKSPYQPGFYLSQEGLSIGDKIKINADGTMYAGNGAVNNSSANHWIINGVTDGNTYISYNTTSLGTTSYSVYLGTNGISLGTTFTVDSNGNLTSKSGTIGGWEIGETELRAQKDGKYIKLKNDGSIEGNYYELNKKRYGWKIEANGDAYFQRGTFGPWTVNTDENAFQGSADNKNSILFWADGNVRGKDISPSSDKSGNYWQIIDSIGYFGNGLIIGPMKTSDRWVINPGGTNQNPIIYSRNGSASLQFGKNGQTASIGYTKVGKSKNRPAITLGSKDITANIDGKLQAKSADIATFDNETSATFKGNVAFGKNGSVNFNGEVDGKSSLSARIKEIINDTYIKGIIDAKYIKGIIDDTYIGSLLETSKIKEATGSGSVSPGSSTVSVGTNEVTVVVGTKKPKK